MHSADTFFAILVVLIDAARSNYLRQGGNWGDPLSPAQGIARCQCLALLHVAADRLVALESRDNCHSTLHLQNRSVRGQSAQYLRDFFTDSRVYLWGRTFCSSEKNDAHPDVQGVPHACFLLYCCCEPMTFQRCRAAICEGRSRPQLRRGQFQRTCRRKNAGEREIAQYTNATFRLLQKHFEI